MRRQRGQHDCQQRPDHASLRKDEGLGLALSVCVPLALLGVVVREQRLKGDGRRS